ncbi:MAG: hypothetical protein MZU95_09120 [Desulfomicrobium escambiense]|nr:hypothetical protein [Desulfomicrobium escambiense]
MKGLEGSTARTADRAAALPDSSARACPSGCSCPEPGRPGDADDVGPARRRHAGP